MKKLDYFDLDQLKDIPKELLNQIKLINVRDDTKCLLELFSIKNPLSINEILIGMYRNNNKIKSRVWVSSTLYNLKRKGLIRKIDETRGFYEMLINKE